MEKLKYQLFTDCNYYFNRLQRRKNAKSPETDDIKFLENSYYALHKVIEKSGLEQEYQCWRGEKNA